MNMSTTNSDQERSETGASVSGNNNYFYNLEMREHMFDKVLTPSDVSKLNRLVIRKEYALKYFHLNHNQKGPVKLDFQDRNGKMWRFHYFYRSSCQNYVLSKGWIRFVKENKLCAGDTLSFHRGYIPDDNAPERRRKIMFIDWRHKDEINLVHNINQERTETEASGSGNNNYFYNSEHMFEKVLTPSEVGYRLVIPKGYALKYFPLDHNLKGPVLMDFQDRNGKTWTFQYLYWSCHSYVMAKGWIRFVNEKKLCAGDIVSFHRGYIPDDNAPERRRKIMFIDWKLRAEAYGRIVNEGRYNARSPLDHHHQLNLGRSEPSVNESVPVFLE